MSDCNDTLEYKNSSNLTGTDGFLYSPTIQFYQLDKIQTDFAKSLVVFPTVNINSFIDNYGQEVFNESILSFNNFLYNANANVNLNLKDNYPLVQERLNKGVAITPIEFSSFMSEAGYNPISIQSQQVSKPKKVLSLFNTYVNGAFSKSSMGSFCELAPAMFGAVANFFTSIRNLASTITDIISSIQNFSLAALLDTLKNKILDVVNSAINKVKSIVENLSLAGVVDQTQEIFQTQVLSRFKQIKDQALAFFEKDNVDKFKSKIEGLISYATGLFKNLDIEEIQFLIYRFCSFINQVENVINGVRNPIDAFSNRYISTYNLLKSRSDLNTASAVAAGAKRFNNNEVYAGAIGGVGAETAAGNAAPPSQAEIDGVTSWNDGNGDGRITFVGGARDRGHESWTRVTPNTRVLAMRLQERFGRQLQITSAYRSAETQRQIIQKAVNDGKYSSFEAAIASGSYARPGNSLHEKGTALDIQWAGFNASSKAEFIRIAREVGFGGIGVRYNSFVHVDTGPVREW